MAHSKVKPRGISDDRRFEIDSAARSLKEQAEVSQDKPLLVQAVKKLKDDRKAIDKAIAVGEKQLKGRSTQKS